VKPLANSFDTVGLLARSVDDCALAVAVLAGDAPERRSVAAIKPTRIGLLRWPDWGKADSDTKRAVETAAEQVARAGVTVEEVALPPMFDDFGATQSMILRFEAARVFAFERSRRGDMLSETGRTEMDIGMATPRRRYLDGLALIQRCRVAFADLLQRFDLILGASAPGEAPRGLDNTGEATFNRLQSGLGVPCLNLPGFAGTNKLPVGVQTIGAMADDYRLLGWSKWIGERIGEGR
jgi:amidase